MTGSEVQTLSRSLHEVVDVLEQSLMRVEEQSHYTARHSPLPVTSVTIRL